MMTERDRYLRRISTMNFAMVELNLYLDTHPADAAINDKLKEYTKKYDALVKEFEEKFGPLTIPDTEQNRWAWISSPWPWDTKEEAEM